VGFLRNNNDAVSKIKSLLVKNEEVWTSAINVHELVEGANLSDNTIKNMEKVDELLQTITILPFDRKCAVISGKISAKKEVLIKPIGQNDIFIAAVAINYNLNLVTRNKKHFETIENIEIEEW